jgi:hypothetical protein
MRHQSVLSYGLTCLFLLTWSTAHAATLHVTSDAIENPAAVTCTLAVPCHFMDARRIAHGNLQDDTIVLDNPSTFGNDIAWTYFPLGAEKDYDFTIIRQGGQGVIDGGGQPVEFYLVNEGTGKITVNGLKLQNIGNANTYGAVMEIKSGGDLVLENVSVINTRSRNWGTPDASGGVHLVSGANVRISNSRIENNIHGGLYVDATHVEILDSSISGNIADSTPSNTAHSGASLLMHSFDIRNTEFLGNEGNQYTIAGGLHLLFKSGVTSGPANSVLFNNRFINNRALNAPAALSLVRRGDFISRIEIDRNLFSGNETDTNVSGAINLDVNTGTRVVLRDNVMINNSTTGTPGQSANYGSAVYAQVSDTGKLYFINNTVVNNDTAATASNSAAVHIYTNDYQAELEVSNNIIYDNPTTRVNFADSDLRLDGDKNASITVRNNNLGQSYIYNGATSPSLSVSGTVLSAPAFANAASEDYHLASNSILIDGGFSSGQLSSSDMDGQARIQGVRVDIGADEFSGQVRRTLTLNKLGNGSGSVATAPSGLVCGTSCSSSSGSFDDGSTVALLALPSEDSKFVKWEGDCSGTALGTLINMSAPKTCTAQFDLIRYNIGISVIGTESGDITSPNTNFPGLNYPFGGNYEVATNVVPGSFVSFTAAVFNPSNAHAFWRNCASYGGVATGQSGSSATCSINNVQSNINLTAEMNNGLVLFPNRNLTISRLGSGFGTVVSTPTGINCGSTCSAGFNFNTNVVLEATPDADSVFSNWSSGCHGNTPSTHVFMSADTVCHAVFNLAYNINVTFSGNASGTLLDNTSGAQTSYPGAPQYTRRYALGTGTVLQANAPVGVTATFSNCETHPGLGLGLSGNGTQQASCTLTNPSMDFSFGLAFNTEQHVQTVQTSGTGTGQVTLNPGGIVLNHPDVGDVSTAPLDYGTLITLVASGTGGSKIYWNNCVGPGASKTGEGTTSSTCSKPLYNTNSVGVEFRAPSAEMIFKNGFE